MKRPGDGFYPKIFYYTCPECKKKGYYEKYAGFEHNWHCKYCGYYGYVPSQAIYRNQTPMRGLNGQTPLKLKQAIAKQTKYKIENIRLFGSRINGGWADDSDLDVVIKDPEKSDLEIFYSSFCGLKCEMRFVESLDISWLKNSV
jgi:rubredoxin